VSQPIEPIIDCRIFQPITITNKWSWLTVAERSIECPATCVQMARVYNVPWVLMTRVATCRVLMSRVYYVPWLLMTRVATWRVLMSRVHDRRSWKAWWRRARGSWSSSISGPAGAGRARSSRPCSRCGCMFISSFVSLNKDIVNKCAVI